MVLLKISNLITLIIIIFLLGFICGNFYKSNNNETIQQNIVAETKGDKQ